MNKKRKSLMALGMTAVLAAAIPIGANAAEVTTGNNPQAAQTIKITSSAALSSTNAAIAPNVRFQMLEGAPLTMTSTALPTLAIRIGSDHNALLTFLGIDEATYLEELKSGKSELQIAEAHGIAKDQLVEFETNAFNANIDQAVKDGKLTEDQASKMKEGFASSLEQRLEGKGPFLTKSVQAVRIDGEGSAGFAVGGPVDFTIGGIPFGEGTPLMGKAIKIGVDLKDLLAFLGTDEATYMEQLKSGKTPLEIAEANGKTKEELLAFESASFAASVDQAVKDGRLSEEEAAKMKADYAEHAEERMEGKPMIFHTTTFDGTASGRTFSQVTSTPAVTLFQ